MNFSYNQTICFCCCLIIGSLSMPSKAMYDDAEEILRHNFFHAIEENNVSELEHFLEKKPEFVNEVFRGWTPLNYASKELCYEAAEFLLKKGAFIHGIKKDGIHSDQPIMRAIAGMQGITSLDYMLYNFKNKKRLYKKIQDIRESGLDVKILELLFDYGANVHGISAESGKGLLLSVLQDYIYSLYNHSKENRDTCQMPMGVIKLLVSKGIDLNAQDPNKKTILHMMIDNTFWSTTASKKDSLEVAEFFLKAGANPNLYDDVRQTSLYKAIKNGLLEFVILLTDYGADRNIVCMSSNDKYIHYMFQETPFQLAIRKGHVKIIRHLLIYMPNNIKGKFKEFENYKDCTISYANEHKRKFEELEN